MQFQLHTSSMLKIQTNLQNLAVEKQKIVDELWMINNVRNIKVTAYEYERICMYKEQLEKRLSKLDAKISSCQKKLLCA